MLSRYRQMLYLLASALSGSACEGHISDGAAPLPRGECEQHADCMRDGAGPANFCTAQRTCRALRSDDCTLIVGRATDPHPIVLGSLFATVGVDANDNLARQNAVQLAVEEINDAGGIPAPGTGGMYRARKLLLVACSAATDAVRAAKHLTELGALAIIGPAENTSVRDVATNATVAAGTLLVSPTALTSNADDVFDADLGWSMAPSVEQRAPLLDAALAGLEAELVLSRSPRLKLGILYRDDALQRATLAALQRRSFAGESLAAPAQTNSRIRTDRMPATAIEREALLASYRQFAPDVVVLLGGAEVVTDWIDALEAVQPPGAPTAPWPQYLLSETAKVPQLLELARNTPTLRARVRGIGTAPTEQALPVFIRFQRHYDSQFSDQGAIVPGAGASYDAVFALANAMAGLETADLQGVHLAERLHSMSSAEHLIPIGALKTSSAFATIAAGEPAAALGTMNALRWDEHGNTSQGALDVWCLSEEVGVARYGSSGLTFDLSTQMLAGRFMPCTLAATPAAGAPAQPPAEVPPLQPTAAGAGGSVAPPVTTMSGNAGAPSSEPPPEMDPDPEPDPAPPTNTPPTGQTIPCGETPCALDRGEFCCVSQTRSWTGSRVEFACSTASTPTPWAPGGNHGRSCSMALRCSSDKVCASGDICCSDGDGASCSELLACTLKIGRRLACESPKDCAAGTVCCLHGGAEAPTTQCEESCTPFLGGQRVCDSVADCPSVTLAKCAPTEAATNMKICKGFGL
ncbi:MAG: hypothetical protein RL701_3562 [Pseudomonadota bacterium]